MQGFMKCYTVTGRRTIEWVEKPIPEPGDFDALIKPVVISACTSDVHIYNHFMCKRNRILGT